MRRISSRMTFAYKWLFPILWFGILLVVLVFGGLVVMRGGHFQAESMFFIVPIAMLGFGYWLMRKLVFDLVDEVLDTGDALIVRNRGREERVALANITNVSYSPFINPPRVTLSLRQPSLFGTKVTFCAPVRFMPFTTSPVVDELIERIDAARRGK